MAKKLTPELYEALKVEAFNLSAGKFEATAHASLDTTAFSLYDFQPPLTFDAWLAATLVSGKPKDIKSRDDRLKAVDRAYKAWIEYAGPEGIAHGGNVENLKNALQSYLGATFRLTGPVSGISIVHRYQRDKHCVLENTLKLCTLISALCTKAAKSCEEKRHHRRCSMLALIANIDVNWNPVASILAGFVVNGHTGECLQGPALQGIVSICTGSDITDIEHISTTRSNNIPGKFRSFVKEQCIKFKHWLAEIFSRHFGMASVGLMLERASRALDLVTVHILDELTDLASGAAHIFEQLKAIVSDAWIRRKPALQKIELAPSDPFTLVRNGIDVGVRNRQEVSAWKIFNDTTTAAIGTHPAGAANKVADLVFSCFELIFKLLYHVAEMMSIKSFVTEAKSMWQKVKSLTPVTLAPKPPVRVSIIQGDWMVPYQRVATIPAFKAANYSATEFMENHRGSYLNFLHTMVKASPILAAVVMSSGVFSDIEDITLRGSTRNADGSERVHHYLRSLKAEAESLFAASTYKITPDTIGC